VSVIAAKRLAGVQRDTSPDCISFGAEDPRQRPLKLSNTK
jgi:hypothetical protein